MAVRDDVFWVCPNCRMRAHAQCAHVEAGTCACRALECGGTRYKQFCHAHERWEISGCRAA